MNLTFQKFAPQATGNFVPLPGEPATDCRSPRHLAAAVGRIFISKGRIT